MGKTNLRINIVIRIEKCIDSVDFLHMLNTASASIHKGEHDGVLLILINKLVSNTRT
jgi:hypothetical protein